jgi:predicted deacylase
MNEAMNEKPYSIELEAPDIEPYRRGNTGVDYVTTLDSGRAGPHVMLSAVVHGNELCGAIALDFLLREAVRPTRGRLTLGFMNVQAYLSFDSDDPTASRYVDEDFNRLWTAEVLDGERDSVELRRAREVRPLVDTVDYLLDIHSMQSSNVPLMMCGALDKGRDLARHLGVPLHVVSDAGHAAGKRMRDYAHFGDPASERNALLVECGQHWEQAAVGVARDVALRFLGHCDVVSRDFIDEHLEGAPPPAQHLIEVTGPYTIETDEFRFDGEFVGMEVIETAGTIIGWDGERPLRTPYDRCVLIMPTRRRRKGESAVRFGRYVD